MLKRKVLLKNELEKVIKDIIDNKTYLKKDENGIYFGEIYVDYTDSLSSESIQEIEFSDNPRETFYNQFDFIEVENIEFHYVLETIKNNWKEEYGEYEDYKYDIIDFLNENVYFNLPYDHFLNEELNIDIIIDTGDGNYDFTLNDFASYNAVKDEKIKEKSSMLWLVKQQGYTREQLECAIRNQVFYNSKFLKSIHAECINTTSHMNALAFFVKMTLRDFIEYLENPTDLTLNEKSSCGLYDCWNGAGSLLEIDLEKPVTIPKEYIQINVDGSRGYGIGEIYGMSDDFWKCTII